MKKIFTSFVLLMATSGVFGAPISKERAQKMAKHFLENKVYTVNGMRTRAAVKNISLHQVASTNAYYIFNVGKQEGFIVTAADDRMVAVLGYAEQGSYNAAQCPKALKYLLAQYQDEMKILKQLPVSKKVATTRAQIKRNAIAPLLKSTWSQYAPYNQQTPLHKDENCVTGCVATAAAQIMNYYQYPTNVPELQSYRTASVHLNVDALPKTTFDWKNMLPNYRVANTKEQQDAVAKLNRYVGQAVKMDYTKEDSGADSYLVVREFPKVFGYAKDMHRVFRDQYSYEEWNNLIYNELKAKHPVYYFAEDIAYDYGHAFVCDGYQDGEYFHINWGWGGMFNGYYRLSVLSPREYGFAKLPSVFVREQGAIIGMKPAEGNEIALKIVDAKEMKALEDKTRSSKTENFIAQYTDLRCVNNYGIDFEAAWGIGFYQDNKLVKGIQLKESEFGTNGRIQKFQSYFNIPADIPNGIYSVKPIFKVKGEDTWKPCGGAEQLSQTIKITDTEMKNITAKAQLKVVDVTFKGTKVAGCPLFVTLTLQNDGKDLLDVFNLNFNWDAVASTTAYIAAGKQTDVVFELYPKSPGRFEYNFDCNSEIKIKKEGSITIADCLSKELPTVEVKVEQCENKSFYAPVMKGKLLVTNKENVPYSAGFDVELRCRKGETNTGTLENKISVLEEIPANKTIEIPFELPNVVIGAQYAVYVDGYKINVKEDYIQGGKMYKAEKKQICKSDFYLAKENINAKIKLLHRNIDALPIYNLQGIKVGKGKYDFNRLPAGVYIIGNKKVIK